MTIDRENSDTVAWRAFDNGRWMFTDNPDNAEIWRNQFGLIVEPLCTGRQLAPRSPSRWSTLSENEKSWHYFLAIDPDDPNGIPTD